MKTEKITVLGIGNILFRDEGVGIRVVERLEGRYHFPDHVSVVDGGVLGLGLLNVLAETKHLIVVDAVKNHGKPGDLYRLRGDDVPKRFLAKNSLHQIDFLETLTALGFRVSNVMSAFGTHELRICSCPLKDIGRHHPEVARGVARGVIEQTLASSSAALASQYLVDVVPDPAGDCEITLRLSRVRATEPAATDVTQR